MNGSGFWEHYRNKGVYDDPDNESQYRAWVTCSPGDFAGFDLIPVLDDTDQPEQDFSYMQIISCLYHRQGGQLSIMCYGMGYSIYLEGTRLRELKRAISERRVRSIHAFDTTRHSPPEEGAPIITKMEIRGPE